MLELLKDSFEADHFTFLVGVRIREKWRYRVMKIGKIKVFAIEKMNQGECKEDYESFQKFRWTCKLM